MHFDFSLHVVFHVKDYEKAVRYYSQVMGMQLLRQDESEAELRCSPITF